MEKRDTTRVVFKVEAIVKSNDRKIRGSVENLSMTGMLLVTPDTLPPESEVTTEILLSGSTSQLKVEIRGRVVRSGSGGMAIQFKEIDLDSFIHLKNIITSNEGDGDKIMNEFYEHLRKH